jgi:hypothetical protein
MLIKILILIVFTFLKVQGGKFPLLLPKKNTDRVKSKFGSSKASVKTRSFEATQRETRMESNSFWDISSSSITIKRRNPRPKSLFIAKILLFLLTISKSLKKFHQNVFTAVFISNRMATKRQNIFLIENVGFVVLGRSIRLRSEGNRKKKLLSHLGLSNFIR